jgi:glycosyltransferase involved in cell wall biosynthesis
VLTCTVVIATRERPAQLAHCLAALSRQTYTNFDVLVVDSAPQSTTARDIASTAGAGYLIEPVGGASRARNAGSRATHADIVAFADDDAVPDPNWLEALAAPFEDARVAGAAGRYLPLQASTDDELRIARLAGADNVTKHLTVFDRSTPQWFERANFGGVGTGEGCMALRRVVFDSWPGFDPRLGRGSGCRGLDAGGEGNYAFFQLAERGHALAHVPDAIVRHPFPLEIDAARRAALDAIAVTAGYATFLFVEEPRYRRRVARYLLEGIRHEQRPWRDTQPAVESVSTRRAALAAIGASTRVAIQLARPSRRNAATRSRTR